MTPEQSSTSLDQSPVTRITGLVRDAVGIDIPDLSTDLLATGIMDSLAFVSLLLAMEQEFGIAINVDSLDLADFQSVERITRFIILQTAGSIPSNGG